MDESTHGGDGEDITSLSGLTFAPSGRWSGLCHSFPYSKPSAFNECFVVVQRLQLYNGWFFDINVEADRLKSDRESTKISIKAFQFTRLLAILALDNCSLQIIEVGSCTVYLNLQVLWKST